MRSGRRILYYWSVFERLFTHPLWAYRTGSFAFASAWPRGLLITLILAGAALVAWSLWRRRALGWQLLLPVAILQTALIALLACLLWRPVLNVERVRDRENELAIAVDASASMAYGSAGQSRLQEVAAALQNETLQRLEKTFAVRLFGFAQSTTPLESLDAMPPPGRQTRIGDALTQVLQSAGSAPLAGVILFSDGAENGDTLSEERLAEIASYGVPVHTVGIGPEQVLDDLELERVEVAPSAPAGATIDAEIGIRHNGASQARLRVYDRDNLVAARDVKLRPDATTTQLSLDLPAGQAGTHELRFVLDPIEGERNVVNNSRTRVVNVPATRRSILYVEGEPRWEYKFMRRAVDRDRALRVASIVRTTPNKHYRQGVNTPDELVDGFPSDRRRAVRLRSGHHRQLRSRRAESRATQVAQRVRRQTRRHRADAGRPLWIVGRRLAERGPGAGLAGATHRPAAGSVRAASRRRRSSPFMAPSPPFPAWTLTRGAIWIVGRTCRRWPTTNHWGA